ncbi:type VII secretion target [Nocardia sp. NPDC058058]|uniref:type VII secretion target n=1 Tax=Nocardia sp. NPDC058058 TaxID=3346317 RepID=UPI0036D763C6
MAEYLNIEPDELRRSAEQYRQIAAQLREWGKIPQAYLDDCAAAFGTFYHPMHRTQTEYYTERREQIERDAQKNEHAAEQLTRMAKEFEETDDLGGRQITNIRNNGVDPDRSSTPTTTTTNPLA